MLKSGLVVLELIYIRDLVNAAVRNMYVQISELIALYKHNELMLVKNVEAMVT